nr:MAG TPA: hypothetical protein [Caudoviricetes sp.]
MQNCKPFPGCRFPGEEKNKNNFKKVAKNS